MQTDLNASTVDIAISSVDHVPGQTERRTPRTLVDIFERALAYWPARAALDDGKQRLTYRQLTVTAQGVADRLAEHGVGRGDRVGVRVPSGTDDLYISVLGTLLAGAAYVPVDFDDPPERAETIWSGADVCAVVGEGRAITGITPGRGRRGPAGANGRLLGHLHLGL
jgi:non-ribosomal peptide synthetase component F